MTERAKDETALRLYRRLYRVDRLAVTLRRRGARNKPFFFVSEVPTMNDEQDTAKLQPLTLDANNERPTANLSALVTRDVLQVLSVFCYIVAGIAVVCTCLPLTVLVRGIVTIFVRKGDMDCVVGFFVAALSMPLVAAGLAIAFLVFKGGRSLARKAKRWKLGL